MTETSAAKIEADVDSRMLTVWLPASLYDALDDEARRLKRATRRRVSMSSLVRELVARRLGMTPTGTVDGRDPYRALELAREALEHVKRTGSLGKPMRDLALMAIDAALELDPEGGKP